MDVFLRRWVQPCPGKHLDMLDIVVWYIPWRRRLQKAFPASAEEVVGAIENPLLDHLPPEAQWDAALTSQGGIPTWSGVHLVRPWPPAQRVLDAQARGLRFARTITMGPHGE